MSTNIELQTYPHPLVTHHLQGSIEEILQQVKELLEKTVKESPGGKRTIVLHAIPDITIMNFTPKIEKCLDCNNIISKEYDDYMLKHEVWFQTGLGTYDGKLCFQCLEKRLKREIVIDDFLDAPVNNRCSHYNNLKTKPLPLRVV